MAEGSDLGRKFSDSNFDSWVEPVSTQFENRKITAQISLRTLKLTSGTKEHQIKLISDDDDCFYYRTVINLDEYKRLAVSNSFIASFDNLPQYFRQLLRAAKQENEYGQSYFINIVASGTLGIVPRIELLITTRHSGYVVQNKVLGLPMTAASDTELKEYLTSRFEKMKKEKDQLRRSASFLESQLRRERAHSREMEDKNHWLRKELKFTQNLLKSAESIQKHYECILSLRHRGETGSTVVTIGDTSGSPISAAASVEPAAPTIDEPSDANIPSTSGYVPSAEDRYESLTPIIHHHKTSSAYSQTSDEIDDRLKSSIKRKVSFRRATDTDSESEDDRAIAEAAAAAADIPGGSGSSVVRKNRPPQRKFAATVSQFDDKLMEIRKQEERKRSERMSNEEEADVQKQQQPESSTSGETSVPRKVARVESGTIDTDQPPSHISSSPVLARSISPPSVVVASSEHDSSTATSSINILPISPPFTKTASQIVEENLPDEHPSDAK